MKKILSRAAICLLAVTLLLAAVSCGGYGKTLLSIKKDGIRASISVNMYELMLSRLKGTVCGSNASASQDSYWDFQDSFDGGPLQTLDEYYRASILENCRTYLAALYLFEREGLTLSADAKEEVEDKMYELLRMDGDGSKTKLNAVLATYGVNYEILEEIYLMEEKVDAVREHLYGENASKLGDNVKAQHLDENFVHFHQIFLASYSYVYKTDARGDKIYYTDEKGSHIAYDTENGVTKKLEDGSLEKDRNGDTVYYVKDTDYKQIAYNSKTGVPIVVTENNQPKTETMGEEALKELKTRAESMLESVKNSTEAQFEAAADEHSEEATDKGEFYDGIYLPIGLDFSKQGASQAYLDEIVEALGEMEIGEVRMIASDFGYHIIKKYEHTEKAYELDGNQDYFFNSYCDFYSDLTTKLFLAECKTHFDAITVDEKLLATAPTMKEVAINYYY